MARDDDEDAPWTRQLLVGAGALVAVALVIGAVVSAVALGAARVSGINDARPTASAVPTLYMPSDEPTTKPEPFPDPEGPTTSGDPSPSPDEPSGPPKKRAKTISLQAFPQRVGPNGRINLTGGFNCAQAVWPHMKEREWGRIINMASVAGTLGGFGQASYSTTKAGLLGLTRTLAMEGGRHGITCNAIVPGIIGTEAFHLGNPAMNERIANRTVFKRPGEPQDVANAIAYLCSDLAAYVTGVALNVSGGVELFVF